MNAIIKFLSQLFGLTPRNVKINTTKKSEVITPHEKNKISNLNEVSLKIDANAIKKNTPDTEKPKKKRYYKKKITNEKPAEVKKEVFNKTTSINKNGTTKKRRQPKKLKPSSTVQFESRSDH
jgi:hypothetical protein